MPVELILRIFGNILRPFFKIFVSKPKPLSCEYPVPYSDWLSEYFFVWL